MVTIQIDKICRACLCEDDEMIDMSKSDIYRKFLLFANLTVEEEIPNISLKLCHSCERKLNTSSLDFKEECRKSHEILLNYVRNTTDSDTKQLEQNFKYYEVKLETTDADTNELKEVSEAVDGFQQSFEDYEVKLEETYADTKPLDVAVQQNCERYEIKLEETFADANELEYMSEAEDDLQENFGDNEAMDANAKKRLQVEVFPQHQVIEAIKDLKERCYKLNKCIKCNYVGSNLRTLSVHITRKHKDFKPHWCCLCNAEFDELTDHVKKNHANDNNCKFCSRKFQTKSQLVQHLPSHSDVKFFQCTYCVKYFSRRNNLNQHLRNHTNENPYKCSFCSRSFVRLRLLNHHIKMHKSNTAVSENFCVKCDKKVHSLVAHMEKVHDNDEQTHSCSVCKEQFRTGDELNQHMHTHSLEADTLSEAIDDLQENFEDDEVTKKRPRVEVFPQNQVLEAIKDSKQRRYKINNCIKCSYVGSNLRSLSVHITRKHKNFKLRWCCSCNAEFDNLTDHVTKNHVNDNNCKFCGRKFPTQSQLIQHLPSHSDVKFFQCTYCENYFSRRNNLNQHLKSHTDENPYKCSFCGRSFVQLRLLNEHIKMHKSDTGVKQLSKAWQNSSVESDKKMHSLVSHTEKVDTRCDSYEATDADHEVKLEVTDSDTPSDLQDNFEDNEATEANLKKRLQVPQHQVVEAIKDTKQRRYKINNCIKCNYVGSNLKSLSVHITRMHKDFKLHWCCQCNDEFENLTDHILTNHSNDNNCKFCARKFPTKSQLIQHLPTHSDVKFFQCTYCDKSFNNRNNLNQHLTNHTKENPYKCSFCDKSFVQLRLLNHHLMVHKSDTAVKQQKHSSEVFRKCTYCDKKIKTHNDLIEHERTHTGERPYVCQVCAKSFSHRKTLKSHMLLHSVGPKIICNVCNKNFFDKNLWHQHLQTHTEEKPYVCTVCGKGFKQRGHLYFHKKTHSDLRPYKCSCCENSFKTNFLLKRHMLLHSEEKKYKCSQCSYACRYSQSLTKHIKKHETDKPQADRPHVCLICNRNFSTNSMLLSHVKRHNVELAS